MPYRKKPKIAPDITACHKALAELVTESGESVSLRNVPRLALENVVRAAADLESREVPDVGIVVNVRPWERFAATLADAVSHVHDLPAVCSGKRSTITGGET
jgi:hypothetical protein